MEIRYRMQSLKTGWGVEAPNNIEGKKSLAQLRRQEKEKFKYARIYLVQQTHPEAFRLCEPFQLTHRVFA